MDRDEGKKEKLYETGIPGTVPEALSKNCGTGFSGRSFVTAAHLSIKELAPDGGGGLPEKAALLQRGDNPLSHVLI